MFCMRVPDGGSIFQLRAAYKCVVGSLSDSYIFGFDVFLFIKPKVLFAFEVKRSMWEFHDRPLDMLTPKYLAQETTSRTCPCNIYEEFEAFREVVSCTIWHLEGLNSMFHIESLSRSCCSMLLS